jgi:hypothetical protein
MPLTNAHHGDDAHRSDDARLDLAARIDAELRARIEDAVDYACLDAMVKAREASGAAAPVADDPGDRDEYNRRVSALLERIRTALVPTLSAEQRARLGAVTNPPGHHDVRAALDAQVALAKELPDYWQRFDELRRAPTIEDDPDFSGSGGDKRRGLFDRLLGR